jgi:hypothetical protein
MTEETPLDYAVEGDEGFEIVPLPELEPVPVFIVDDDRDRNDVVLWGTAPFFIDTNRCVQVAGRDPARTSLVLVNTGSSTVFVSPEESTLTAFGFPIEANGSLEMVTTEPVFATVATGTTSTLVVLWERRLLNG